MDNSKLKNRLGDKVQSLNETPEGTGLAVAEEEAMPVSSDYIALTGNALEIIKENLKNQPLSLPLFDIVKSPSGGATAFTVPGLSGDEIYKELTGIVLGYTTPRAYWDTPDPVEGTPPVCSSPDSMVSYDGRPCNTCQFNDFGSKDGESNAKACKESVLLFFLQPDSIMPIVIRIPVTSKRAFQRYATRLIGRMMPISGVVTRITLEKTTNKAGQPYALYHFEAAGILTQEEAARSKLFGKHFMEMVESSEIVVDIKEAG